jgi:hypothetical protein
MWRVSGDVKRAILTRRKDELRLTRPRRRRNLRNKRENSHRRLSLLWGITVPKRVACRPWCMFGRRDSSGGLGSRLAASRRGGLRGAVYSNVWMRSEWRAWMRSRSPTRLDPRLRTESGSALAVCSASVAVVGPRPAIISPGQPVSPSSTDGALRGATATAGGVPNGGPVRPSRVDSAARDSERRPAADS